MSLSQLRKVHLGSDIHSFFFQLLIELLVGNGSFINHLLEAAIIASFESQVIHLSDYAVLNVRKVRNMSQLADDLARSCSAFHELPHQLLLCGSALDGEAFVILFIKRPID